MITVHMGYKTDAEYQAGTAPAIFGPDPSAPSAVSGHNAT
jgi:hypothetical protein